MRRSSTGPAIERMLRGRSAPAQKLAVMLESVATTRVASVPPAAPHSPRAGGPGTAGPRKASVTTRPWRPLASARGRILGWSVLLLAAALAASTVATHLLLVRQLNARVSAELTH